MGRIMMVFCNLGSFLILFLKCQSVVAKKFYIREMSSCIVCNFLVFSIIGLRWMKERSPFVTN